jgi:UDP-N-acetylmuramoyl-L-alanyl-D-glutamate--2,6-diaminopimelate ligase
MTRPTSENTIVAIENPASCGVSLSTLAHGIGGSVRGIGDPNIVGVHHDSRLVEPGDLFVARRGERSDGLRFVGQAIERGAVALMVESQQATDLSNDESSIPTLVVQDIRKAIGDAANILYGDPTAQMNVVGITGTNGKTTTSYMVRAAVDSAGGACGVLGTLGAACKNLRFPAAFSTPEADEVTRIAAAMQKHGATHLVMEVTSHALDQRRADGVHFRVAAFTNLTQDHLDYHKTLEAYAAAKDRLFFELSPRSAVIMIDDPHGEKLSQRVRNVVDRVWTVSARPDAHADIRPEGTVRFHARGFACTVRTPQGLCAVDVPFVGQHNLANVVLTLGIVSALGLPVEKAAEALANSPPVPGRLERCDSELDDITVLVDFAHTPDALERALRAIRPLTEGKIHCVFGCGGDRDRSKRPLMGQIVGQLADVAIVTNDNPRSEIPEAIADQIREGMQTASANVVVQLDRKKAISMAIGQARSGDVVLIAGKGHEPVQIIGAKTVAFDDRDEARSALEQRRSSSRCEKEDV